MSEFETLADLFAPDRQPTRELEPIQKVDRTDQIERDIEEFYPTKSAKRVLEETTHIVAERGLPHRFRYVHATFESGKSHLLKLLGVATGEMEGLEDQAHRLANTISGFKQFRDALADSHIDHLIPLFMNLLDRDRDDTTLPLMVFEELGRRRGYPISRSWLLEFCWQLDIEHGLWKPLQEYEHEGLRLDDVVDRPASLRPWLRQAIPQLEGATGAGLGTEEAVQTVIDTAVKTVSDGSFDPEDLVDRLDRTKRHLDRHGGVHQFLIGLDEIAIFVGDQPRRYEEVVDTITALIDGINPPILGTGQWKMRDMQQDFVGEVDEDAWYAQEIQLEGADTETIVRKRWLQKSDSGNDYIESELLPKSPSIEPDLCDTTTENYEDPAEAYPFRDTDLRLLRESMEGLITGERETDREYIQGRALLIRVRSLFADHGWADREPGAIVSWDVLYDTIAADTALIPGWATDLIERVRTTFDDQLATRTAKALFLLSQTETVPRTPANIARLLVDDVTTDLDELTEQVKTQLDELANKNLIREDVEESPSTYTILSEEDIRFWQEVHQEATELPEHQLRENIQQFIQQADQDRLTSPDNNATRTFGNVEDVAYSIRYSVIRPIPDSVTEKYDTIVVRLIAHEQDTLREQRDRWQTKNSGPNGRENVLVGVEVTEALRQQVRQLIGMQTVLSGMADPDPQYRLDRQNLEEDIEDTLRERLHEAQVYLPTRETGYGSYLDAFDEAIADAVDAKFPDRHNIERPLQLDDLSALVTFFDGDGSWPFTDTDAERLGVNTVPRTIDDGWVTEFLSVFEDEDRVSGERIMETIEGRGGAFLGTPPQALHALLFVLVADNRIEVRTDGERVTDISTLARIITSRSRFEDAVVGFDPEPPAEGLDDVYEALLGESPDTDDTTVLLEDIGAWANQNGSTIRTVVSKTNLEFESHLSLGDLEAALEPAFSGEPLDADDLTNPAVVEQAKRYPDLVSVFTSPDEEADPLWDRFNSAYQLLNDLYPTASIVNQMQVYAMGSQIPDAATLESQIEQATEFRIDQLQTVHQHLSGSDSSADTIDSLLNAITDMLTTTGLREDIERVEDTYETVSLDDLRSLIDQADATADSLPEKKLADKSVRTDAETLANGRALLEIKEDEETLYEQLVAIDASLPDSRDGFVATQITDAIRGARIPGPDRAQQLIKQGRSIQSGSGSDDDSDTELEQLWMNVTDHEEGTIVVIDPEAER